MLGFVNRSFMAAKVHLHDFVHGQLLLSAPPTEMWQQFR